LGVPSLAQLEQLLAHDPRDAFVLYALAQEHAKLGHTPLAAEFYDRCVESDPTYCYAYFHKARLLIHAGDHRGAAHTIDAGLAAARQAQDAKALAELESLRDSLELEGS
jgi:tetratricopeptide (TPR) repeat protein